MLLLVFTSETRSSFILQVWFCAVFDLLLLFSIYFASYFCSPLHYLSSKYNKSIDGLRGAVEPNQLLFGSMEFI